MYSNDKIEALREKALDLVVERVDIPGGYVYKNCMLVNHDALPVFIFRYEKESGENNGLGGEHFSVSVDLEATKVMGFMHIDEIHCGTGLPEDEEFSKDIATKTLKRCAPDLVDQHEVKWVLSLKENPEKIPHESPFPFYDDEGHEHLVTGVRVKLFFKEINSWGWVIVGREGKIIAFEREVIWNEIMVRRSTPAWLHDPYVLELNTDIVEVAA